MSKVISFRLNPDNPREQKALEILMSWSSKGFRIRHTLTEALLNFDSINSETTANGTLMDLSQQIMELLENVEIRSLPELPKKVSSKAKLSDRFVSSIIQTSKPGLRSEA